MSDVAQRLRVIRAGRGMTLREAADSIERVTGHRMSFSYLSELERGGKVTPSLETLERIGAGYGLSVCDVIGCGSPQMEGWVWPS